MTLDNFIKTIQKNDRRHHKFSNSYGVYDAYKYYRKNKPKDKKYILSESQYFSIIRSINNRLREDLVLGKEVELPHEMGRLEIRKYNATVSLKDGKVKTNRPIDWKATLQLWYQDEQSYKNKTLIKTESKELFTIYYNRRIAKYINKIFFEFEPNEQLKKNLSGNIKKGLIEAFKL